MKQKRRTLVTLSFLVVIVGTYIILNSFIVLDRTNQELGIYEYVLIPADVEVLVEGTGKHIVNGKAVSTILKIQNIHWNKSSIGLDEGSEIKANEYFAVYNNYQVSGTAFLPGRSIYSMGTSYKRLKKREQKVIHLKLNKEVNQFWIIPEELIKK